MPPVKQTRHRAVDDDDTGGGLPIMLFPSDSESDADTIVEKHAKPSSRAVDRREAGRQDEEHLQQPQEQQIDPWSVEAGKDSQGNALAFDYVAIAK